MRKTYLATLACALIVTAATAFPLPATAQGIERIEIVEYGIYQGDIKAEPDDTGVLHKTVTNTHHVTTTTIVPADPGVGFGIRYRIVGKPAGQEVTLRMVVLYPVGGIKPPQSPTPLQSNEQRLAVKIGDTRFAGYNFGDPWELVPGTWVLQLFDGERKLAERAFIAVKR